MRPKTGNAVAPNFGACATDPRTPVDPRGEVDIF